MLVGGIYNAFKSRKGQGLTDNPYQSEMFSSGQVEAFEQMRENGLLTKETITQLKDLSEAQKKVLELMGEKDIGMQEAIKELGESAQESGGLLQAFKSKGLDAIKDIGMAIGNFAAAALLSAAISVAIKLADEWINHTKHLNDSAQSFGTQMKSTEKDLDSYAEKIAAQKAIIEDNKSSIQDVTQARTTLHELQKQMIETYGNERDTINAITSAIDGESDAIDRNIAKLKERQYQNSIEDFNKENGGWMQRMTAPMKKDRVRDDGTTVLVPMTAFEQFMHNMEHSKVNMSELLNLSTPELKKVYDKYAQEHGWSDDPSQVTDHVDVLMDFFDEYTSTLEMIYNSVDGGMTEGQYDAIKKQTSKLRTPVRETSEKNRDLYDQTMLHELRTGMYSDTYDLLGDLYTQYTKAETEQAKEEILQAYSDAINWIRADKTIDYGFKEALLNLYPVLKAETDKWTFDVKFETDEDALKTQVATALGGIVRANNGEAYSSEDLLDWNNAEHTTDENTAYAALQGIADQYNVSVDNVIKHAEDAGLILSRELTELVKVTGRGVLDSLSSTERAAISDFKGAALRFEAYYKTGFKKFEDEAKARSYAVSKLLRDAMTQANAPKSNEQKIAGYAGVTSSLGTVSKLYDDVKDGKGFDWSFFTDDFKKQFANLDDYENAYSEFIDTLRKSPSDIDACQHAFDKFATAIVQSSGVLDGLDLEDKDAAIQTLTNSGFDLESATRFVNAALAESAAKTQADADAKQYLEDTSYDLVNATIQEASEFILEGNAADEVKQALARLYLQKIATNNATINTVGDIKNLADLARAAHLTREELAKLKISALKAVQSAENAQANALAASGQAGSAGAFHQFQTLTDNVVKELGGVETVEPLDLGSFTGGNSSNGGGGGGGGGGSDRAKERQEAEEEWAWEDRALQLKRNRLEEIKNLLNSQYIINQDAEKANDQLSSAFANLNNVKELLSEKGIDADSSDFQEFIKNFQPDDIPILDPDNSNAALVENVDLIRDYISALDDVRNADTETSKTLHENGKGKLSYLEEAIDLQKELIDDQKTRLAGLSTELEDQFKQIREIAGEDAEEWIDNIKNGDLNPEQKYKVTTYDQNNEEEKKFVEQIKKAVSLQDDYNSKTKELLADEEELVNTEQERYQLQLNIIKARQAEIESLLDSAQHDIDMKEIEGRVVQISDYERLIDINDDLISNYREQLSVLKEQQSTLDEDEDAYIDVTSQIRDCESAIRDCIKQSAEWNQTILRMPIEHMYKFSQLLGNLGKVLDNWLSVQDAKGIAQSADQIQQSWSDAFEEITEEQGGYQVQLSELRDLIENYDMGSAKFSEVDDEIAGVQDSMAGLLAEMVELNRQLLMLPVDKIAEMTEYLNSTMSDLQSVQSDFEVAINSVISLIEKEQETLQKTYDDLADATQKQIDALQETLDQLGKENDQRARALALEQARYELDKARSQKTVQVIRNGMVQYEADEQAIRDAQQNLSDAEYDALTGEIQDQIDDLQKGLDDAAKQLDDDLKNLSDILEERWQTIIPDTETLRNEEIASQVFADLFGVQNWKELVLAGKDANGVYADESIYQGMRQSYQTNSEQQRDTQRQIDVNDLITTNLTQLVEDFQAEKITSEQLLTKLDSLGRVVQDGLVTGQDRLASTLMMGDYDTLGHALHGASEERNAQLDFFRENLVTADENQKTVNDLFAEWNDFSSWYNEQRQLLKDEFAKIDLYGSRAVKWFDDHDDDDDIAEYGGVWESSSRDPEDYRGDASYNDVGHYSDGLEKGAIGSLTPSDRFKAIQALGLRKLDPDEFPAILHLGEGVINPRQQSTMLDNMRQALALGGSGTGAVIQMSFGDISLPSVTNGQDFAESLAVQFQPAMNQVFSKIFRR